MNNEVNSSGSGSTSVPDTGREAKFLGIEFKTWTNIIVPISVATIGLIGAVIAVLPAYYTYRTGPTQTPILAPTSSPTPTDTPIPFTDTPSPTVSPTSTPNIAITPSETIMLTPEPNLVVLLSYDKSAGRPPLTVKFDARESYLIASDGEQFPCKYGNCDFTWKVILEGKQLEKSQVDSSGRFQFTFGKRGTYLVSVMVCRGKEAVLCNGNGVYIEVG